MPPTEPSHDRDRDARKVVVQSERLELLDQLQAVLEPIMVGLGLAFLALLIVDYAGPNLSARVQGWLDRSITAIWIVFLVDFALRFIVAPSKIRFLRGNWLGALSLALPFLRPLRALRAARAVRSLSLVRLLGGTNRGIRVLRRIARGRQIAYVAALTVLVVLVGAAGGLFFDRSAPDTTITGFGDALWWATTLVTTINAQLYAVSPEARVIAILLRLYAVSVFGLVTAAIASYLVGSAVEATTGGNGDALREEIVALRREVSALRDRIDAGP